jgi:hypothetical protein
MSLSLTPAIVISGGQTIDNLSIFSGDGGAEVLSGGVLSAPHVAGDVTNYGIGAGGYVIVYGEIVSGLVDEIWSSGGIAYTGPGGQVTIAAGGISEYTTLAPTGQEYVLSGGDAENTTDNGGLYISSGGIANNVTGGGAEIINGGTVSNTSLSFGSFGGDRLSPPAALTTPSSTPLARAGATGLL